jgi:hypothetical protein
MKKRIIALLLLAICPVLLANDKTSLTMLHSIFKEVIVIDGALVVKTKSSGQRFLFSIEGSDPSLLDYDQAITLPPGFSKADFRTRGYSLSLTKDLVDTSKYMVSEIIDTRSAGGEKQRTEKPLLITTEGALIPEE